MTKQFDFDETDRTEWRSLGIYYQVDDDSKEWQIFGDKEGIKNFGKIISDYCDQPENSGISEHIHLGPYNYLKIMTWDKPLITTYFIAGRIEDLKTLSEMIFKKTENLEPGNVFSIDKEFGDENEAKITIHIMPNNFDPVSMDQQLRV